MKVLAAFTDKSISEVLMEFYDPDPREPIKVLFYGDECSTDVVSSAKAGCPSAYNILKDMKILDYGESLCVGFGFREAVDTYTHTVGKSAGLAFLLKFVGEILEWKKQLNSTFTVMATGYVSDYTRNAHINAVRSIQKKVLGAIDVLNQDDMIFYPLENDNEIPAELRKKANDKGIKLISVSTVQEAVKKLYDSLIEGPEPIEVDINGECIRQEGVEYFLEADISEKEKNDIIFTL